MSAKRVVHTQKNCRPHHRLRGQAKRRPVRSHTSTPAMRAEAQSTGISGFVHNDRRPAARS
ncbi:hypothetical protein CU666_21680 [Pseudomonas syringae pv. actinidifoliorum]|nr:hypothetical protein [Pseudomonas syringae pv. actinidifoliorum]